MCWITSHWDILHHFKSIESFYIIFSHLTSFSVIWLHSESFDSILVQFEWFHFILLHFQSFESLYFESFYFIFSHFKSFQSILSLITSFWVIWLTLSHLSHDWDISFRSLRPSFKSRIPSLIHRYCWIPCFLALVLRHSKHF